ncbi:phage head closure protein [Listeria fleischmannii]|uniref:Phage head-tail adaptor n=1 Tax=Listeria fleischmannii FSL S10-1203 TaxID=1265822 RepID=W7DND9_9LIST|nr:phage head closure protein [Listeria fleischmannii]EUJ56630.1 phage head-tail adaptor [Listeria fleischmannii FSL S10-1203]
MQKVNHDCYNDGILNYGTLQTIRTNNGRRATDKVFNSSGFLHFEEMSIREQDRIVCGAMDSILDLKVKTPFRKEARTCKKVKAYGSIYDVITIDKDATRLFWYLQKAGDKSVDRREY